MASVFSAPSMASSRPVRHHHGLADVERAEGAHHVEAARDVGHLVRLGLESADGALADQQLRRHLDRGDDLEAFALEEAHDAAQHAVVAGRRDDAGDGGRLGKKPRSGLMAPRSGRRHRADDDHLGDAGVAQGAHHAADLRPVDPGERKIAQVAIGLAVDAHDVHRSATRLDALGDLARQAAAARQNADDARLARHI